MGRRWKKGKLILTEIPIGAKTWYLKVFKITTLKVAKKINTCTYLYTYVDVLVIVGHLEGKHSEEWLLTMRISCCGLQWGKYVNVYVP